MAKLPELDWKSNQSPARNARAHLPGLVNDYFRAGRELLAGTPSPQELHAFRLRTKRLRYTLELFHACYGPVLHKRLADLRVLQQLLGEMNDCVAAQRLLPPMKDFLEDLAARRTALFVKHWKEDFDKPGAQAAWLRYLRRTKPRRSAAKRK
jgi:CHAD domain-containing protein